MKGAREKVGSGKSEGERKEGGRVWCVGGGSKTAWNGALGDDTSEHPLVMEEEAEEKENQEKETSKKKIYQEKIGKEKTKERKGAK